MWFCYRNRCFFRPTIRFLYPSTFYSKDHSFWGYQASLRAMGDPTTQRGHPFGERPKYLIRDNDAKFGIAFDNLAESSGIKVLKTPIAAPKANGLCERFFRSLRQECLDHFLILSERHLTRVLKEYGQYYNTLRPHQGIKQQIPVVPVQSLPQRGKIIRFPVLNGLHQVYKRTA